MAKTLDQKKEIVAKLEDALKGAASSVFVHFTGISVAQETKMRRELRSDEIGYTVAKKTLIRRALDTLGHVHAETPLDGEVAIAYNTSADADPTLAARRVHAFSKEFGAGKLTIVGGIFEGKFVGAESMQEIATIPTLQVLRGMFVNVINSPIQGLVVALNQIAEKKA